MLCIVANSSGEAFSFAHSVLLITGVNGIGKTTTIAKLAELAKNEGNKILLVATDILRAAATEQLVIFLGEWLGVPVIRHQTGTDPAAITPNNMAAANKRVTAAFIHCLSGTPPPDKTP